MQVQIDEVDFAQEADFRIVKPKQVKGKKKAKAQRKPSVTFPPK